MKSKFITAILLGGCLKRSHAKSLWSASPAGYGPETSDDYLLKTGYPIGNGRLGVISFGAPASEKLNLNVDSLWSGGPFESSEYNGGNPTEPKYSALTDIRATIFKDGTGDVSPILGSGAYYGSNRILGNITFSIPDIESYSNYKRSLDLDTGIHNTEFTSGGADFTTSLFCSYPDNVCVYHIESTEALPAISVAFENLLTSQDLMTISCAGNNSAWATGSTHSGSPQGMNFSATATTLGQLAAEMSCEEPGSLVIESSEGQKAQTVIIAAATDYDQTKGNEAAGYSFRGDDSPDLIVSNTISKIASETYETLLARHLDDYQALAGAFRLELPDTKQSSAIETAELFDGYDWEDTAGDPFLESLIFDYARHLLVSSSRTGSLPANLQGRWTERLDPAWSADYHANINLQMNYWAAEQTGLGDATESALWDYMQNTWAPRGAETAQLLYGADVGWVVHNEMNIFGHTALKEGAEWANYPAAAAWMMQHVWDRFDYTQDIEWLRTQGYPLMKGVAQFWVSQLQEDEFSDDGTLVVNPCNSPETGPTTFGCAHYQQLIHQVFDNVLQSAAVLGKAGEGEEQQFLENVTASLTRLDRGIHIAEWGGIKEWKLPDSYGFDGPSTHRHLSHLIGWYPGYAMSSYAGGYYTNENETTIRDAVRATLIARGAGNADDANAGWAKVWRAACWARLDNATAAHTELRYALKLNFAANGLSMYDGLDPPFQIDANFGFAGAVLAMLVVDLPLPYYDVKKTAVKREEEEGKRTVVLGPAIPAAWGGGSVAGLRIRGGASVDFQWDVDGVATTATATASSGNAGGIVFVNARGDVLDEI